MLYWGTTSLVIFALLLVILSFTDVLSDPARKLQQALEVQFSNTYSDLTSHFDTLTARSIRLSKQASEEIEEFLTYGVSISALNDQSECLLELQQALYPLLDTAIQAGPYSGTFVVIDATVNTNTENAAHSRCGIYLRFASLSTADPVNQRVIYFRGAPSIARVAGLELHNRWNLEFDVDGLPGYQEAMEQSVTRLSDAYFWTERINLRDTWEDAMLLCVPVLNSDGSVCGLCGVELSDLYFRLTYPAPKSEFGHMIIALGTSNGNTLNLENGLLGGQDSTHLEAKTFRIQKDRYFNTYTSMGQETYLGIHQELSLPTQHGEKLTLAILMPERNYQAAAFLNRLNWIGGSLAFLLLMLALALFLSRRFVKPIIQSLEAIQQDSSVPCYGSGISEIDGFLQFIQSREKDRHIGENDLPPNIAELFDAFFKRVETLTAAEKSILQYYIEGYEIADVPEKAFISISTVRKHNSNIYRKLEVTSREELMLYIELFRRCGRLEELECFPPTIK